MISYTAKAGQPSATADVQVGFERVLDSVEGPQVGLRGRRGRAEKRG